MFDAELYLDQLFAHAIRGAEDLHDYQEYAVDWLYDHPYSALFAGTGLGKTIMLLTLLDRVYSEGYTAKTLIAAPIKVANTVWRQEASRWEHTAWLSSSLLRIENDDPRIVAEKKRIDRKLTPELKEIADRKEAAKIKVSLVQQHLTAMKERLRKNMLRSRSHIHVANHEMIDWLVDYYVARRKPWPYRILVWDEASKLRDHMSNVFTAIKDMRPYMDRVHLLTATPAKQSYIYFFSQIYMLDRGKRFGREITHFRNRYFSQNIYSKKYTLRPGAAEEMERLMSDIVLPMSKEDYSDLQKPIIRIRPVRLKDNTKEKYKSFEQTAILLTPTEEVIEAKSAAILNGKLLQLATGAVYDQNRGVHYYHEEKFDELEQLLDETLDEPVIATYWFKPTLERLKKRFPKAQVMDKAGRMIERWQKKPPKLMLLHPASSAHGVDGLQHVCHQMAIVDLFHSSELFGQIVDRINRQGQNHPVTVHLLAARGTVDGIVAKRLQIMEDAQDAMYRRLQRLHRKLRK